MKNASLPVLSLLLLGKSLLLAQAPGTLDPTFGTAGITITNLGESADVCWAAARQPDGKILLAGRMDKGSGNEAVVTRLLPNGAFDPVFGIRKISIAGRSSTAYAIAVQPDGKILVAGETTVGTSLTADFFVTRLMPNGTADPNFGSPNNGYVVTDLGAMQQDDRANNILLLPDGKIVLTGTSADETSLDIMPAALRLNADGSLDGTFGTGGQFVGPGMTQQQGLLRLASGLLPDGKIILATHRLNPQGTDDDLLLLRLTGAGQLDNSFGTNGLKELPHAGNDLAYHLFIQPDGKILMGGFQVDDPTSTTDMLVARCLSDGSPDLSFSGDGFQIISASETTERIWSIAADASGQVFAAGSAVSPPGFTGPHVTLLRMSADGDAYDVAVTDFGAANPTARALLLLPDGKKIMVGTAGGDFAVARFTATQLPDPTFGANGVLRYPLSGLDNRYQALALLPDGKFLAAGEVASQFAVSKHLPDGQLDMTFGKNGIAELNLLSGLDLAYAVHVSPDGKIWLSGTASNNNSTQARLAVARFTATGVPDSTFDADGFVLQAMGTALAPVNTSGLASALQPDGKIVVGGKILGGGFVLMRFLSSGALDPAFGTGGKVETQFPNFTEEEIAELRVLPNGKILAVGTGAQTSSGRARFLLARYQANGLLDNTFGQGNGLQNTEFGTGSNSFALAAAVLPDGKTLAVGGSFNASGILQVALARYTPTGAADISFGNVGTVVFQPAGANTAYAIDVAVQPDGQLLLAGYHNNTGAVFRAKSDGSPDPTFGTGGAFVMPVLPASFGNVALAGALQADGKFLAVGNKQGLEYDAVMFRLLTGISVGLLDAPASFAALLLYPNPVRDGQIRLEYELPAVSPVRIELFDLQGKSLATLLRAERFSGKNMETLMLPEGLTAGVYLLNVQAEWGNAVVKIQIQNP